ncbi:MAG TPA: histidine kinase dimerization/phosphoacceptor domain -containing protein, partial [Spirochaetota bacterium]|nr:histidine kinase dimerization/phosphoacceptor domain -containing protein [Spirochaetota bacterium]
MDPITDKILIISRDTKGLLHESAILKKNGFSVCPVVISGGDIIISDLSEGAGLALLDVPGLEEPAEAARQLSGRHGIPVIFVIKHDEEKVMPELETVPNSGIIHAGSGEMVIISAVKIALSLNDCTNKYSYESAALRESEATLETLVDNIPVEFWAMDRDLRYTMQNLTSIRNYGDVRGKKIEELDVPDDVKQQWIEQDLRVLNGELLNDEYIRNVNGEERFYANLVSPVYVDSRVVSIVGIGIDITERKGVESELARALDEKNALFKELQHRTKNNMAILSSLVELELGLASGPEVSGHLESLKNRIYLIGILYNLLYYSEGVDMVRLDRYLTEIAGNISYVYKSVQGYIKLDLNFEPVEINAKRGVSIGLILNELLTNSYKYA